MNLDSTGWVQTMARDLRSLGVRAGGVLLVHASLRSLALERGAGSNGAELVVRALLEALGGDGTLLMPALSYETVGARHPTFDARTTPSCVGALPEYFRVRAGTLRSVHPTHSVSGVGSRAAGLLAGHHLDETPCGPRSPFARLPEVGGQVLFLGCGLRPNTSMHAIEEHVVPPYLYGPVIEYRLIHADGTETTARVRSHNFAGYTQRYDRIETVIAPEGLRQGQVLGAACHLLEAEAMWATALAALRRDPFFFVDH